MLYLSFYSTQYSIAIEDSNVYTLDQIRDFDDTESIHETNRLLCLGMTFFMYSFLNLFTSLFMITYLLVYNLFMY